MAGRKQSAGMELAIGATVLAAVIMLLLMLLVWGNSSTFLSKHYWVVVEMANVGGLREGAPVKIGGFQIGKVSTIQLRPGQTDLEIALSIEDDRLLPSGSTAKISTAGLVGDAFLEIIPGKESGTIKRAATIAEAERIKSHPAPDFSELLTQVNALGEKLNTLTGFINEILGDPNFRTNIKRIATNLDTVSSEAIILLQRGHRVVDNVERATFNIAGITDDLKAKIDNVTTKVDDIAGRVVGITEKIGDIAASTKEAVGNLDGGITDIRKAVNSTLGDPELAKNLSASIKNVSEVTGALSAKREDIESLLANFKTISGDLAAVGARVKEITDHIEPERISGTINSLSGAITGVTDVVEKIKNDPVLALSVNKAADRIVKMKFDEMAKNPQFKGADATMQEIKRWTSDALNRGHYVDPSYQYQNRPYVME